MKPIKLTMTAFGPYKDTEIIHFSQLHEHGIFVVSGTTGAGKTTIFDAITFALYDVGSGEDRSKVDLLRSDFAEPGVATEVELIFEVKGRIYRIWRKFTEKSAKREFYDITNGENIPVVEKFQVRSIQQKVEELLGLTQSQFNQIVMLPQGEFQKLLTSESKHKEEIFRKIFKTERFEQMTAILKEKRDEAKELAEDAQKKQTQYVQQIQARLPERDSKLFTIVQAENLNLYHVKEALEEEANYYLEQSKKYEQLYKEALHTFEKQQKRYAEQELLNERLATFNEQKQRLQSLQQKQPHFNAIEQQIEQADKAAKIVLLETQYRNCVDAINRQQQQNNHLEQLVQHNDETLQLAQQTFEHQKQQVTHLEQLKRHITQLELLEPSYIDAKVRQQNVDGLQQQLAFKEPIIKQWQQSVEELNARVNKYEQTIEHLEQEVSNINNVYAQQQNLRQAIEIVQQAVLAQQQCEQLIQVVAQSEQQARQANARYEGIEQQLRSNHAAYLAGKLEDGCACPVCGSKEHPSVAVMQTTMNVDEREVAQLRQAANVASNQFIAEQSKLDVMQEQLQKLLQQLHQQNLTIEELAIYETDFKATTAHYNELLTKQKHLQRYKAELKNVHVQHQQAQQQLQMEQQAIQNIVSKLQVEQALLEQSKQQMDERYETLEQLQQVIQQLHTEAKRMQQQFDYAQQQFEQAKQQQQKAMLELAHGKQRIAEYQQQCHQQRSAFFQALEEANFADEEHYQAAKMPQQHMDEQRAQLEYYRQQLHTLSTAIQEQEQLLKDKHHIDLSELQQAVNEANEAMKHMYEQLMVAHNFQSYCYETITLLENSTEKIEAYIQKLRKVEHVYDLIRGQNNAKISFERFVQLGYLEQVTQAATARLKHLSNGQYFLKCTGRKEGNAQSGLSIDVFDSNTGQTRDVKTLSGGEKFNASLSLALGMADVIQSSQGSVQIDTMFIDEGFGTLDSESLQKAIEVLIELQRTGRLIGVISHVEELKAQMPAILQVEKQQAGFSKTKIIIK